MNLKEIRLQFRDMSGRYDLVGDEGENTGSDFYINEAVRWLDRHTDINQAWATSLIYSYPDMWYTRFTPARAIRSVKIDCSDICIVPPYKLFAEIDHLNGKLDTRIPCRCSILTSYNLPLDDYPVSEYRQMFAQIGALPDEPTGEEVNLAVFNTIIPDDSLIMFNGMWYQVRLVKDEDMNFWSITHPALLINAAIRQTYVTSGNQAMLQVIEEAIARDIAMFSIDRTEETMKGPSFMRSVY